MEGQNIFISSCSRRELARRRPNRGALRLPIVVRATGLQIMIALLVLAAAFGVFVAGRGGV